MRSFILYPLLINIFFIELKYSTTKKKHLQRCIGTHQTQNMGMNKVDKEEIFEWKKKIQIRSNMVKKCLFSCKSASVKKKL